jgi:hypothetical protein
LLRKRKLSNRPRSSEKRGGEVTGFETTSGVSIEIYLIASLIWVGYALYKPIRIGSGTWPWRWNERTRRKIDAMQKMTGEAKRGRREAGATGHSRGGLS